MNNEDRQYVESLTAWGESYDEVMDDIQKLAGMLALKIRILQQVHEEEEEKRNVAMSTEFHREVIQYDANYKNRKLIGYANDHGQVKLLDGSILGISL